MIDPDYERDLSADAKINKHRLDVAAENQADLYAYWASKAADLRKEADGKENQLKFEKATLATQLRSTLAKVTEGAITEGVVSNPKIQEMEQALVDLSHKRNLAEAAVRAMDHRKSMIEVLMRLWVASYFGDPNTNTRSEELAQGQRRALNRKMETD